MIEQSQKSSNSSSKFFLGITTLFVTFIVWMWFAKVDITTYTGAVSIDWSTGTTFKMGSSLTGGIEFDFTNFKQGQVITFYNLTGSQTITFDSDAGTSETFNKVGAVDYDGSTTNMIQVECIDDSANAIFNYSVAAYTSDTTPS